jgi:hypothetical protein
MLEMRPSHAARAGCAAHNNAAWCSALCAAHGDAGTWTRQAWLRHTPAPPYYPNLVTLLPTIGDAALKALLQQLPAGPCGVKDSFARLDLSRHGFRTLFEADWLWRDPADALPPPSALDWRPVDSPALLADWEASWWREAEPQAGPMRPRLFPAGLLQRPDLLFVAGHDGPRLVAGGVWSRTQAPGAGAVLGLACCFGQEGDDPSVRAALLHAAARWCPGLPQVGYESGSGAAQARACGFTPVGRLRVWLRDADPA